MSALLAKKIEEDIKAAMKDGERLKVSTLRLAQGAVKNKEIALLKKEAGLSDEEIIDVLRSEVKKRKDSVAQFQKAGRMDLVEQEKGELEILQAYLPAEISDEDLERILKDGIREAGAKGAGDFGAVMKVAMPTLKGKASGDRISALLKKLLG